MGVKASDVGGIMLD